MRLIELKMIILFANEMFCGTDMDLDINFHVSQTSVRNNPDGILTVNDKKSCQVSSEHSKIGTGIEGRSMMIRK